MENLGCLNIRVARYIIVFIHKTWPIFSSLYCIHSYWKRRWIVLSRTLHFLSQQSTKNLIELTFDYFALLGSIAAFQQLKALERLYFHYCWGCSNVLSLLAKPTDEEMSSSHKIVLEFSMSDSNDSSNRIVRSCRRTRNRCSESSDEEWQILKMQHTSFKRCLPFAFHWQSCSGKNSRVLKSLPWWIKELMRRKRKEILLLRYRPNNYRNIVNSKPYEGFRGCFVMTSNKLYFVGFPRRSAVSYVGCKYINFSCRSLRLQSGNGFDGDQR
jgi:hypothetical protein